jgi:S1-C subfamily serine protease
MHSPSLTSGIWARLLGSSTSVIILLSGCSPVNPNPEPQSLYEAPLAYAELVSKATSSTFEVSCRGQWRGTGWAIQLEGEANGYLVTAFHVVEECVDSGKIKARNHLRSPFELQLLSYDGRYWDNVTTDLDKVRDLALLSSDQSINGLEVEPEGPQVGNWVAVVGYPGVHSGEEPLFTVGNVAGFNDYRMISIDAVTNRGNSGGPVLNSRGLVIGTYFASAKLKNSEPIGLVQPIRIHCQLVFECQGIKPIIPLTLSPETIAEAGND